MTEQLDIMVIPFQKNSGIVLPKKVIEYVLPYAKPLPSSYRHDALVGSIIYQNEKVPIVDVSILDKHQPVADEDSGRRRLVIVPCFNNAHREFSSYALLADDAPRLFHCSESSIEETIEEVEAPFYSVIKLEELPKNRLLVLNLESLEDVVFGDNIYE